MLIQRRSATLGSALLALSLGAIGSAYAASDTLTPGRQSGSTQVQSGAAVEATSSGTDKSTSASAEFGKLDKDGDGVLSRSEGKRNKDVAKSWNQLDVNKDGKLDAMEFSQFELNPADAAQKR